MPKLYFRVSGAEDAYGYQYAYIDLDHARASRLLTYRSLVAALQTHDSSFYGVEFFNEAVTIGHSAVLDEVGDDFDYGSWRVCANPTEALVVHPSRTDVCTLIVKDDGILWTFRPHNVNATCETEMISWDDIVAVSENVSPSFESFLIPREESEEFAPPVTSAYVIPTQFRASLNDPVIALTTRLVIADYLDENDDPIGAEGLRWSIRAGLAPVYIDGNWEKYEVSEEHCNAWNWMHPRCTSTYVDVIRASVPASMASYGQRPDATPVEFWWPPYATGADAVDALIRAYKALSAVVREDLKNWRTGT